MYLFGMFPSQIQVFTFGKSMQQMAILHYFQQISAQQSNMLLRTLSLCHQYTRIQVISSIAKRFDKNTVHNWKFVQCPKRVLTRATGNKCPNN